jgi:Glycosyl hydrolases family 16
VTLPVPGTDPLSMIGVTATTQSASNPSGVAMPSGDLPGWKQVYSDDFSTSVPLGGFSGCTDGQTIMSSTCTGLPSSVASQLWAYPDGWSDTSGNGQYTPSQVLSIHNNMLDYYLHTSGSTHMVAAVVPKIPDGVSGNGLQYGAYAIRFKSDLIAGYKTAFLLWPDSGIWPADGEIDFPEGNLNGTIGAYMHQMNATSGSQQNAYSSNTTYSSWHTAVIEWTPTTCRFILDGQIIGTSVSLIPNTPMHWVLQAETALSGGAPASSVSGHIYIAWITAYAQDAGL